MLRKLSAYGQRHLHNGMDIMHETHPVLMAKDTKILLQIVNKLQVFWEGGNIYQNSTRTDGYYLLKINNICKCSTNYTQES